MGVNVEEAKPAGGPVRPKRGPIVPIPANAPKMPDFDKHRAECDTVKKTIEALYDKISASKKRLEDSKHDDQRRKKIDEQNALINQKKASAQEITHLRGRLQEYFKTSNAARRMVRDGERSLRDASRAGQLDLTEKDIEKQIADLEYKLESGSTSSVKAEKKIIQEMKVLRGKKTQVSATHNDIEAQLTEAEKHRDSADRAADQAAEVQAKMDLERAKVADLLEQISAKSAEIDELSANSEQKKVREEQNAWYDDIKKKKESVDKKRKEFDEARDLFREWKKDYDKQCDAERERRNVERQKENEERDIKRKEQVILLESIKRMNPFEAQIAGAETLIAYLRNKIVFVSKEDKPVEKKTHFDPEATNLGKFKVLKKVDGDKDDLLDFGKKKKNTAVAKHVSKPMAPKPVAAGQEDAKPVNRKPLKHSMEKHEAFDQIKVKMPTFVDEVKATIEVLSAKKKEWQSHIKTEKEAMAEEAAEQAKARAATAAKDADAEE